jgi:hypothetical protein
LLKDHLLDFTVCVLYKSLVLFAIFHRHFLS